MAEEHQMSVEDTELPDLLQPLEPADHVYRSLPEVSKVLETVALAFQNAMVLKKYDPWFGVLAHINC